MLKQALKNINKGVFYMLIAAFCFAVCGAFAKALGQSMPAVEIVFFRNIMGVAIIIVSVFKRPIRNKGGKPFLLLFRAVIGTLALLAFFYNIANISLADATTFSLTSPIFTALFAYWFLKEDIGIKGWAAVFIGFIGIVLIMKPSGLAFAKTDLLGIFCGIGAALAYTSIRELKKFYDTRTIVLSFMITGAIMPVVLMFLGEFWESKELDFMLAKFVMPNGWDWIYILGLGIFATLAQITMTQAYGVTKAGIVSAVGYTHILFAMILGLLMGDAFPDILGLIGTILIVVGGIMVAKEKK